MTLQPRRTAPTFCKEEGQSDGGGRSGLAIHPAITAGVCMMIGAAVWFFLGLAAGYIYFYPPVMFVLGIVSIVKGFTGGD